MPNAEAASRPTAASPLPLIAATGACLGIAAALALWWRFGDGVYGQALVSAVIACF